MKWLDERLMFLGCTTNLMMVVVGEYTTFSPDKITDHL